MSGSEGSDDQVWVLGMLDYEDRRYEPLRIMRTLAVEAQWECYETLEDAKQAAALRVLADGGIS